MAAPGLLSGTLFALAAGLMWGLVFIGPLLLPGYPAALQSFGRYVAFGLIALPLAIADRRALARLTLADWLEAVKLGLVGNIVLVLLFFALVWRSFAIAINAPTLFARLLAAAIGLIMFTYAFVNMGMVSGILPVVGVPLPFISYGGTALVTLGMACGLLMAIAAHRKLVQS